MPPEAKRSITTLAEMVCENCVYSCPITIGIEPETINNFGDECCNPDSFGGKIEFPQTDFCSKGRWMLHDHTYLDISVSMEPLSDGPWPTEYDDCYYLIMRKGK